MKKGSLLLFFMFVSFLGFSQKDTSQARIILIGDAGDFNNGKHPVIDAVKQNEKLDKKTTIIFLGDNLYSTGLPDMQSSIYDIKRAVLDTQVHIARGTDAKVVVIPGNHDWDRGGKGGWDAVLRQQDYITAAGDKNVRFLPEGGCPGTVEVPLSDDVLMVVFDSQWWIHPYEKPGIESDCPYKTKLELLTQMEDIVNSNPKKLIIIACHHPSKAMVFMEATLR